MENKGQEEEGKLGRDWLKGTSPRFVWLKQANGWQRIWVVLTSVAVIYAFVSCVYKFIRSSAFGVPEGLAFITLSFALYVVAAVGLTLLFSSLLYLLGWIIGWIIRGFRSRGN